MKAAIVTAQPNPFASAIPKAFAIYARAQHLGVAPLDLAEQMNASPTIVANLKAATAAMTTDTSGASTLIVGAISAWSDSLGEASAFARMFAAGDFRRLPFRIRSIVVSEGATAAVVGEGRAVPIGTLNLSADKVLEPERIAATVVLTKELFDEAPAESQALIERELSKAAATTLDTAMVERIITTATPTVSASSSADAAHGDLNDLFAALNPDRSTVPYLVGAPDVCRGAAFLWSSGGGKVFPEARIDGGSLVGVPIYPSDALSPGELLAIDANRIAGNLDSVRFEVARQASVKMDTAPAMNAIAPTEAQMVSLWQNGLRAARAQLVFGCRPIRDDVAALMTGVSWGDVGSPA